MNMPLFWRQEYFNLREDSDGKRLFFDGKAWKDSKDCTSLDLYPTLTIQMKSNIVKSPFSATYGGVYIPRNYSYEGENLVGELIKYLSNQNTERIEIYLAPEHLAYFEMIPSKEYIESGFNLSYINTNHYIDLSKWHREDMSKGNRKKSRKAQESNYIFFEATGENFRASYDLIVQNRLKFGAEVSLNFDEISLLFEKFPNEYKCFALKTRDGELVASAFLVETSVENLYVHLWADSIAFRSESPVVLLMEKLIELYSQKYKFLDLGTSGDGGAEIEGLVRFKNNLGAIRTGKKKVIWEAKSTKDLH